MTRFDIPDSRIVSYERIRKQMAFAGNRIMNCPSKMARKLAKAVKHAKNAGVFNAAGKGEPVVVRAKNTDGLEEKFSEVFSQRGFVTVQIDMAIMTQEGLDKAAKTLCEEHLKSAVIVYNVNRKDKAANDKLIELLHRRHDAIEAADFDKPYAMNLVILHDAEVEGGVAFDAVKDEDIDSLLS